MPIVPYQTNITGHQFNEINTYDADKLVSEFKRIELGQQSIKTEVEKIKKIKTIHQALRTGIVQASTTNATEPFDFGDAGIVLEQFTLINADLARSGGKITSLILSVNASLSATTAGTTANAKVLFKMEGSTFTRHSGTSTVIGTTPQMFFAVSDFMPFIDEFQNGDMFFGVGIWKTAGGGLVRLGNTSQSEPNTYAELVYQVELP